MQSRSSLCAVPVIPPLPSTYVRPAGPADEELEWFFTMAHASMGVRSNFMDSVDPAYDGEASLDERVDAAHAYRVIGARLRALEAPHPGVLKVAYDARAWPRALREELRQLTGVVVRLEAASAILPSEASLVAFEAQAAVRLNLTFLRDGASALERGRAKAQAFFDRAYDAYRAARGDTANLVRGLR